MSFSDLMLFALSSNQDLAERVSKEMGLPLGKSTVRQFSDGEIQVNIEESIRGKEVYILQSTSSPVNDNFNGNIDHGRRLKTCQCSNH